MPDNKNSLTGWSSAVWQYAIAFLGVSAAALIRLQLTPVIGSDVPLLTFFVPVLVMAWYLDFWPGVVATLLSAVAVIFVRPAAFSPGWTGWARVVGFFLVVLAISYLNDKRRAAARAQARQADMLRIVLEQMPLGILIAEAPGGKVLMSNGRLDHMLGPPVPLRQTLRLTVNTKVFIWTVSNTRPQKIRLRAQSGTESWWKTKSFIPNAVMARTPCCACVLLLSGIPMDRSSQGWRRLLM